MYLSISRNWPARRDISSLDLLQVTWVAAGEECVGKLDVLGGVHCGVIVLPMTAIILSKL
jgi:hypothetical protein